MNTVINNKKAVYLWIKRGLIYCLGLFIMAAGVVFSVRSALGVSPVTCLASVTSQISGWNLGVCTAATYCLYILAELIILRRSFKAAMLLQIAVSFFSVCWSGLPCACFHSCPRRTAMSCA